MRLWLNHPPGSHAKHHREGSSTVVTLQVTVDSQRESVLVPIYGVMVPLHITAVRNVAHTTEVEGSGALIRISLNFGWVNILDPLVQL